MGADMGRIPEDTVWSRPNGAGSQPQGAQGHSGAADRVPAVSPGLPPKRPKNPRFSQVALSLTPSPPQPGGVQHSCAPTTPPQPTGTGTAMGMPMRCGRAVAVGGWAGGRVGGGEAAWGAWGQPTVAPHHCDRTERTAICPTPGGSVELIRGDRPVYFGPQSRSDVAVVLTSFPPREPT